MAVALVCNVLSIVEIGAVTCCLDWQEQSTTINMVHFNNIFFIREYRINLYTNHSNGCRRILIIQGTNNNGNATKYIRTLYLLCNHRESVEDEDMIYALTVKEEIIRQLYCYIEELPSEQRRIILMRIEGHTWEEIAERLEISINTVKTQKTRSYKFLRERLGDSVHSIILCLFL